MLMVAGLMLASTVGVTPVLATTVVPAWHVNTYECEAPGSSGGVIVPDADWASGGLTVFIAGTQTKVGQVGQGESLDLPAGSYRGEWKDSEEEEFFKIKNDCPRSELQVDAQMMVCGDPRMWVQGINDGDVDSAIKWVFYKGSMKKFGKVTLKKSLPAGTTKVWGPRWVRGSGAMVKIRAWNPLTEDWDLLMKFPQRGTAPWGTAGCPDDRFGEPDWDQAHRSTLTD